ncbi:MAG TPA: phosphate propanoyltransferase [Bacilli bacterium]|nr:phosphate propanoyltransferase [Bacilli bacterium]
MKKILVETSARHIHISQEHLEILCGKNSELEVRAMLSQPGQYASNTRLQVVGPKGSFPSVTILGPTRKESQVEVSLTDARLLGLTVPVRESGDIEGTPGIKLIGPKGEVTLEKGLIVAKRHVHMTPSDAASFNVKNSELVQIKVKSGDRSLIFDDVVIRVREDFALAMHIDTDEANAAGICGEVFGELIKKD